MARRHDINANVLFRRRREYQLGILKPAPRPNQNETFISAGVIDHDGKLVPPTTLKPAAPTLDAEPPVKMQQHPAVKALPPPAPAPASRPAPPGVLELHLSNRIKIRIQGDVNKDVLRGVLAVARELA